MITPVTRKQPWRIWVNVSHEPMWTDNNRKTKYMKTMNISYGMYCMWRFVAHVDGLAQDCSNSIALAMELLQSCTKPSNRCIHECVVLLVYLWSLGSQKITPKLLIYRLSLSNFGDFMELFICILSLYSIDCDQAMPVFAFSVGLYFLTWCLQGTAAGLLKDLLYQT